MSDILNLFQNRGASGSPSRLGTRSRSPGMKKSTQKVTLDFSYVLSTNSSQIQACYYILESPEIR